MSAGVLACYGHLPDIQILFTHIWASATKETVIYSNFKNVSVRMFDHADVQTTDQVQIEANE